MRSMLSPAASAALLALPAPVAAQLAPGADADPDTAAVGPPGDEAVEERAMPAPLSFQQIGLGDGLPQATAREIVQDDIGYVWVGTEDGLARYDGNNMRVFRSSPEDPDTMLGNWVNALAVDPRGRLWVGTNDGLSIYNPERDTFTRLEPDPDDGGAVRPGGITDIHLGEEGAWLARMQGGLDFVEYDSLEAEWLSDGPLEAPITAMAVADDETFWLGTDVGMLTFDPLTGEAEEFEPEGDAPHSLSWSQMDAVYVDSAGLIWIGSEDDGLFVVDPDSGEALRHDTHDEDDPQSLAGDQITAFHEDDQNRMWIGTVTGLSVYDREAGEYERYNHDPMNPQGLPGAWVETIFQDRGGVVWLGMRAHGIALFDELRMNFAHHHTRVTAMTLHEDPDGVIWAGTVSGGGLYRFDPEQNRQRVYRRLGEEGDPDSVELSRARIWGLHRPSDSPDELWIGTTEHGAIRFNTETEEFERYHTGNSPGLDSDWIWDFWEDPDGLLWMATWGGGIAVYDPSDDSFSTYGTDELPGLTSDAIYTLYPDPIDPDLLWIGTGEGGLCELALSTVSVDCHTYEEDDPESLSGNNVAGIHRTEDGDLWIATHGEGLNRMDPDTGAAEHFRADDSPLETDTLYSILSDDDGDLWMSSANGLYQIDPESEDFIRYGAGDGLQADEFAMLGAHEGRGGKLLFSGVGGFNVFDPADIEPDTYAPPVAITDFRSFDEDIPLDAPIWMLPSVDVAHTSSFEFEFAALSFADPGANEFAYKLEGFDTEWIEGRRFATYGQLDGGTYTLKVRAANRHGAWNEEGVSLDIHVTPPPWRTWWAYGLYGLGIVGALFGYRRYHQSRLQRLEQATRLQAVERDLEITGAVQHGFLPAENAVEDGKLRMFGFYRAAEACGGDWWWHEQPAPGIHHILVGDVTGHGPGPAMVTAAVATAYRVQSNLASRPLTEKVDILNREVMLAGQGKYHMTLAAVEINERDGTFTFFSAGSTPLLRLPPEGRARAMPCRGTPLGSSEFELGRIQDQLQPGERLLLFTDGIPELEIAPDRLLGMRRFSRMFEQTREFGLEEATSTVVSAADRLRGEATQEDDWTLVVIEWG